eukprot:6181029-Pleurochrysis_carterae.AAC.2
MQVVTGGRRRGGEFDHESGSGTAGTDEQRQQRQCGRTAKRRLVSVRVRLGLAPTLTLIRTSTKSGVDDAEQRTRRRRD